jgi:hypothetical protein
MLGKPVELLKFSKHSKLNAMGTLPVGFGNAGIAHKYAIKSTEGSNVKRDVKRRSKNLIYYSYQEDEISSVHRRTCHMCFSLIAF